MLSGYPNGYEKINSEWSRINNLHKKIVKFISANIAQKYEMTANDTLSYLLGKTIVCDDKLHLQLIFASNAKF